MTAVLTRNVAPGIHKLEHAHVNCYLVEDSDGVLLVDTALPRTWLHLISAMEAIERPLSDLRAVVLTHAHFDHVGMARRLQQELGLTVHVHADDEHLAAHPYSYAHETPRLLYPVQYPAAVPVLTRMALAGALAVRGVHEVAFITDGQTLDLPGRPRVIHSPGHTFGHCGLHFADRDAVMTGDALVTLDPYTAEIGPQIVAGAATADSAMALLSLEALAETDAARVLPGHGEILRTGIRRAVREALVAGPS
ncbi:glyoxylase-like metal-dependent hydrolase (beta-lactamase superfamily II) [Diaminobutyricimonas aerilata]|uniref:Glyoxylase-like metal-dependent hydrolase (Beta-lactamase superfamily II) n=1 Tax=Diaminobutyricimonas aerilata TaxID=1162967 RepID=A0A2M9CL30_9MICO|nr:MBL fold metallo-hydrolase [Diaminobutyricimonas aerilata]PJJ72608.1 glyoxylase-like metal-dependent hydrolase (beta-lactamase superfamily II) [Diaminobutyricimonas aerilata]